MSKKISDSVRQAKEIDKQIANYTQRQSNRARMIKTASPTIDNKIKELRDIRKTLPPETPMYNNYSGLGSNVAFWAGGTFEEAIHTIINYKSEKGSKNRAGVVISHEGGIVANNAFIRGTIMATDGIFNGTIYANEGRFSGMVSIADGKILLNTDGSGQLADGSIKWDAEGNLLFESNQNGNRIVIDPSSRTIKMIDAQGRTLSNQYFNTNSGGSYAGLQLTSYFDDKKYSTLITGGQISLYSNSGGVFSDELSISIGEGSLRIHFNNDSLPSNRNDVNQWGLYRDGETLKIRTN